MTRSLNPLHFVAVCLLLTLLAVACSDESTVEPTVNDPEITELAEQILAAFEVADSAMVLFAGPVEPETILQEDQNAESDPVSLQVPATAGTYYVLLIDDEPERLFEHPVRFAWIDLDTGLTASVSAGHWMTVLRPDIDPAPFNPVQYDEVLGVDVYFMEGEGGVDPASIDHKSEVGRRIPGDRSPARGKVYKALVFDGGDKKGILEGAGYFGAKNWRSIAGEMSKQNADPMAEYLEANDFTVQRVSQYWGNSNPYFTGAAQLYAQIVAYGAEFTALGPPDNGCDTFFLYITAHGYEDGAGVFEIYPPGGTLNMDFGQYSEVLASFDDFPEYVKVTIMVDNCYGGKLISEHTDKINELCGSLCALTLITTVDATHAAWAPSNVHDSGTEDFMEGADDNGDGDETTGDIQDRFKEMARQGSWLGPQSFHCPEGGSWCHLDGPEDPTESVCMIYEGSYTPSVTSVIDPEGHGEYVGEPLANPVTATIENSTITISGTPPFVAVSGSITQECSFLLSGSGTVAGYPNVSVLLEGGFFDDDLMWFSYTMGAGGELPGEQSITYTGEGVLIR